LKEDINDRLTWHSGIDATNIQVKVENGEVTLEGSVSDRNQKRMAEDLAEQIQGVNEVQNHLRVKSQSESGSSSMSGMGQSGSSMSGMSQSGSGSSSQSGSGSTSQSGSGSGSSSKRSSSSSSGSQQGDKETSSSAVPNGKSR